MKTVKMPLDIPKSLVQSIAKKIDWAKMSEEAIRTKMSELLGIVTLSGRKYGITLRQTKPKETQAIVVPDDCPNIVLNRLSMVDFSMLNKIYLIGAKALILNALDRDRSIPKVIK